MTHRSGGARSSRPRFIDRFFTVSVILKGIDGLLEVAGGLLFLTVDPRTLNAAVRFLTANELSEDPADVVANALRHAAAHLTRDIAAFAAIYLVAHGLVKLLLAAGLLRRRTWAFPTALVVLGAFVVYQSYRVVLGHSLAMAALTVADLVVIWAVWREFRLIRRARPAVGAVRP